MPGKGVGVNTRASPWCIVGHWKPAGTLQHMLLPEGSKHAVTSSNDYVHVGLCRLEGAGRPW